MIACLINIIGIMEQGKNSNYQSKNPYIFWLDLLSGLFCLPYKKLMTTRNMACSSCREFWELVLYMNIHIFSSSTDYLSSFQKSGFHGKAFELFDISKYFNRTRKAVLLIPLFKLQLTPRLTLLYFRSFFFN